MVRVEDRIVVGVDDFVAAALAQFGRGAIRQEAAELGGITPKIRGAVVAHHVQHENRVAVDPAQLGRQAARQDFIAALRSSHRSGAVAGVDFSYSTPAPLHTPLQPDWLSSHFTA